MISRMKFVSSAQQEIMSFSGPYAQEKKSMALEMMDHGLAWTSIASSNGFERKKRRQHKKECKDYILTNYKPEPQISGFIFSSFIFSMIFSWVLKWIVNKIIDDYILPVNEGE